MRTENRQHVFYFKSKDEARKVFRVDIRSIRKLLQQKNCDTALLKIPGERDIEISERTLAAMQDFGEPASGLFFSDTSLPPAVIRQAAQRLDGSSDRWGIVRLRDERQVIMSSGMGDSLLAGVGIDETTQWRRAEYWDLGYLAEFSKTWRRELSEGAGSLEYRYKIKKKGSPGPFFWYTSLYRLIRGEDNLLYQICDFVGTD